MDFTTSPSPTSSTTSTKSTRTVSSKSKILLTACYLSSSTTSSTSNIINPANNPSIHKEKLQHKITKIPRGGSNKEDYYKILGISKTATPTEIKKAYRRKALETHPDKNNGNRKEFDEISKAYDILSNEESRNVYDRFGHAGLDGSKGAGMNSKFAEDIFNSFFGGHRHSGSSFFSNMYPQRQSKVRYQIQITLEELYKGTSKRIQLPTKKECTINIKPGMKSGDKIVLSGEYETSGSPGDVILIVQQAPHSVYTRKNNDLALRINISFNECIQGFTKTIPFLDGTNLTFQYIPEENKELIITKLEYDRQTNEYYYIFKLSGKGMPKKSKYYTYDDEVDDYGDLYIQANVKLPTKRKKGKLTNEERVQLGKLLDKLFHETTTPATNTKNGMKLEENASLYNFGSMEHEEDDDHDHTFFSDDEEDMFHGHRHTFSFGNMFDHMHQQQRHFGDNVQCQQM